MLEFQRKKYKKIYCASKIHFKYHENTEEFQTRTLKKYTKFFENTPRILREYSEYFDTPIVKKA